MYTGGERNVSIHRIITMVLMHRLANSWEQMTASPFSKRQLESKQRRARIAWLEQLEDRKLLAGDIGNITVQPSALVVLLVELAR
jgi:hypothetical protein